MTSTPAAGGGQSYSLSLQMLLFMTALTFIPAMLLMMTSFTRVVIVLDFVRRALSLQQMPPTQVIVGLAIFLTAFIMVVALLADLFVTPWLVRVLNLFRRETP